MGSKFITTIDKDGPFFTTDPVKTFRQNIRALMDVVAAEGEADVVAQLRGGEGSRAPVRGVTPNRVSGHVVGRTSGLRGKRWAVTAVVSVSTAGLGRSRAIALQAAGSRIEGQSHPFRRTAARLRRMRAKAEAELMKGIA